MIIFALLLGKLKLKRYMTLRNYYNLLIVSLFTALLFFSCKSSKDEPDDIITKNKMTVLVYAENTNLSALPSDKAEMLEGAKNMNLNGLTLLIYEVNTSGNPRLLELKKNETGNPTFEILKEYSRSEYSIAPERISEVIKDTRTLKEAEKYGLILWSHGLGWEPFFENNTSRSENILAESTEDNIMMDLPLNYSFGADSSAGEIKKINIDELADAIPDDMFEYIWFDACMMSGIETIYELRNKCNYFGGYPTEIYNPGMPYDRILPYLLSSNPDLVGCAKQVYNYYADSECTIAVVDMSKLESVADYCRQAYIGAETVPTTGLQYYSGNQRVTYRFYDFGQYTKLMAESNPNAGSIDEFDKLMNALVIYKEATAYDFSYSKKPINPENYSGISCHRYDPEQSDRVIDYYKTLDWFKRVYE